MKGREKIFLSQCMIVKNEAENIERALSWGRGIVDEQIVVDTGSTDGTAELARKAGARVYEFAWRDDFSAAKNFAIEKARGRWIAFLDADEYFSREDAAKMRTYAKKLDGGPYGQILSAWLHVDNEGRTMAVGTQVRVFVNAPYLRYRRRIHEYLASSDPKRGLMTDAVAELTIFHTGYGKRENEKKNKERRNLRLIQMELADHPQDCDMLGYLGDEHYSFGEYEEAEEAFRSSIARMPDKLDVYDVRASLTFTKLLEMLIRQNRPPEDILPIYSQAREKLPKEADFDYLIGYYYTERKEWEKAGEHLALALDILQNGGSTARSMMLSGQVDRAYEMLALCFYEEKDMNGCVRFAAAVLGQNHYRMPSLRLLLSAFREKTEAGREEETVQAVFSFLEKIYDISSLRDILFMIQGARQAGWAALETRLRGLLSPEQEKQLSQSEHRS